MKKIIFILILISGMIWNLSIFAHGIEEEEKGKAIWEKLESKALNCENLSDNDFEALGEYFMGQMAGISHEAMNKMMEQMMGKEGEEKMHVVMGKRMSGCDLDAEMPQDMMSMMKMMDGGSSMMRIGWWNNNYFWLNTVTYLLIWIFLIVAIISLVFWILKQRKN